MAGIKILAAVGAFLVIAAFIGVGETAVAIQKSIEKPDKYAGECGCYSDVLDVVLLTLVEVNPVDGVHCRRFIYNVLVSSEVQLQKLMDMAEATVTVVEGAAGSASGSGVGSEIKQRPTRSRAPGKASKPK